MAKASPPNILYLMTDQQKASASPVYGNRLAPSPFMQKMADQGVAFDNFYTTSPICTPSRTSVFTGVHPLVHQVTCHQNRAPYNLPQMQELLQDAGYHTSAVGHYEPDRDLTRGWDEQVSHAEAGPVAAAMTRWYSHGRSDVGWSSGTIDIGPQEGHASWLTFRALKLLDELEAIDEPFFLHLPLLEPHPPYFVTPPYDTMVDHQDVPTPEEGPESSRPDWHKIARETYGTDEATDEDVRKMVAVYYGMIAYADDQMRRLYDEMHRRGLMENTWVIISSDHGDYAGEKGLFMKTESLYECLLHVPLIIRPPDGVDWARNQRIFGLIEQVDLFPTILGLAGARVPEYAQGHDLVSWVAGGAKEPLRDAAFAQVGDYHGNLKTTMPSGIIEVGRHPSLIQGARTAELSYVRDLDLGDEAYDLRSDPRELVNLIDGGLESSDVADLRRDIDRWEEECVRLRDEMGVRPGYRGFDGNQ